MINIRKTLQNTLRRNWNYDPVRAYLDQSVSIADLERRQREVEQGLFRRSANYPF